MLSFGSAFAKQVKDWRDLDAVHKHVQQAINEMNRARAKNHYDMSSHETRAEAHLRETVAAFLFGISVNLVTPDF